MGRRQWNEMLVVPMMLSTLYGLDWYMGNTFTTFANCLCCYSKCFLKSMFYFKILPVINTLYENVGLTTGALGILANFWVIANQMRRVTDVEQRIRLVIKNSSSDMEKLENTIFREGFEILRDQVPTKGMEEILAEQEASLKIITYPTKGNQRHHEVRKPTVTFKTPLVETVHIQQDKDLYNFKQEREHLNLIDSDEPFELLSDLKSSMKSNINLRAVYEEESEPQRVEMLLDLDNNSEPCDSPHFLHDVIEEGSVLSDDAQCGDN